MGFAPSKPPGKKLRKMYVFEEQRVKLTIFAAIPTSESSVWMYLALTNRFGKKHLQLEVQLESRNLLMIRFGCMRKNVRRVP